MAVVTPPCPARCLKGAEGRGVCLGHVRPTALSSWLRGNVRPRAPPPSQARTPTPPGPPSGRASMMVPPATTSTARQDSLGPYWCRAPTHHFKILVGGLSVCMIGRVKRGHLGDLWLIRLLPRAAPTGTRLLAPCVLGVHVLDDWASHLGAPLAPPAFVARRAARAERAARDPSKPPGAKQ